MFLERIAIISLQVRAKLLDFFNYLLRETDSQLGQIFFTCCLFFLTALLFYVWTHPSALWLQIGFTALYLVTALFCISAIYFILKRKRIGTRSNTMEVYTLNFQRQKEFQNLHLMSLPLTELQTAAIFKAFSLKYLNGNF